MTVSFGAVVSTFEVVNGKGVTVIANDACPSIAVDKSSGVNIVITKEAAKNFPNVVTSCTSEVNITVPGPTDDADPVR